MTTRLDLEIDDVHVGDKVTFTVTGEVVEEYNNRRVAIGCKSFSIDEIEDVLDGALVKVERETQEPHTFDVGTVFTSDWRGIIDRDNARFIVTLRNGEKTAFLLSSDDNYRSNWHQALYGSNPAFTNVKVEHRPS